jgi:hypothetical protein
MSRPGLSALLIVVSLTYFTIGSTEVLFTPMVLSFASPKELGLLLSLGGVGWLIGSVLLSVWKNTQSLIKIVLAAIFLQGFLLCGAGWYFSIVSLPIFAGGLLAYTFACPIIIGFSQTIWQNKVAPSEQGRVFSSRFAFEWSLKLFSFIIAGPLADKVFEPLFSANNPLVSSISWFTGVGDGRGIAVMFSLIGIINIVTVVFAYRYPHLRRLEDEIFVLPEN